MKEKTKKLLSLQYTPVERSATAETKVFCFFSSEKKALLYPFLTMLSTIAPNSAAAAVNAAITTRSRSP